MLLPQRQFLAKTKLFSLSLALLQPAQARRWQ
jgi:hypothetical protein